MNHGFNLKPGINYCAPKNQIGYRGAAGNNVARLIPLPGTPGDRTEIGFFHGVDVPANLLPYLPEQSSFEAAGYCHYYKITCGIFVVYLTPSNGSVFTMEEVLQAVWFEGQEKPTVFLDQRDELFRQGLLNLPELQKIQELLAAIQIPVN